MHENKCEPVLLPTLTEAKIENFVGNKKLSGLKGCLKMNYSVILPLGYEEDYHLNPQLPCLPAIAKGFEVVVDVRLLPDGQRQIAQIYVLKNTKLKCIYRSRQFLDLQTSAAG